MRINIYLRLWGKRGLISKLTEGDVPVVES